jgi:hypothetical protein
MTCARNPDLDPICRSTALAPMPATTRGRSPDRHPLGSTCAKWRRVEQRDQVTPVPAISVPAP